MTNMLSSGITAPYILQQLWRPWYHKFEIVPRVVRCNSTWLAAVWARPGPGPGKDSDYTGHRARVQIEQQSGNVRTIMIIAPSHWVALTSTAAAGPGDRPRRRTICTRTLNRTPCRRPGPPPQRRPAPRRAGPRPGQGAGGNGRRGRLKLVSSKSFTDRDRCRSVDDGLYEGDLSLYEPGGAEWEFEGEEPGMQYDVQYCTIYDNINNFVQYI
jgi:hypothetical protein